MAEFIEVAANKASLACRKTVHGVGINDAWYKTSGKDTEGNDARCPYYKTWRNMLMRAYCTKYQIEQPSYLGCTVSKQWHLFSTFRQWMEKQDWRGKELDKDLLQEGNKEYNPDICIFVTRRLNSLLINGKSMRGPYPQGVSWNKKSGRYLVQCSLSGRRVNVGYYDNLQEAELAHCKVKGRGIAEAAYSEEALADSRLTPALLRHAAKFTERAEELTKLINKTT